MLDALEDAEGLVLDTSVTSLLMGDPRRRYAAEYRSMIAGRPFGIPMAVIAELMQGALNDGWGPRRRAALITFVNRLPHFRPTFTTAYHWAAIRAECRGLGINVTENDAWIAATALSFDGVLLTHDRDHLRMQAAVPQLQVLSLLAP
ncbi:MAG: PIN domain-containing protein [Chloroflexota bacterium]|nr:PIN domain-containing protein [Chloroflexota bacterium]